MAQREAPPQPASPTAPPTVRARRFRIGVIVAAILLVAAYGLGRIQGKLRADAAEQRVAESKAETARASHEFETQRDRALQLEARRRLHLALLALEEQNFGIAKNHVKKAALLLRRAGGNPGLDALAKQLETMKLDAGGDAGAIRGALVAAVRNFDAALPPVEP